VQRGGYFAQAGTHLVLDHMENPYNISLRQLQAQDYPSKLAPIEDGRFSNSLGVGLILYYKRDGEYLPYTPLRTNGVSVFEDSINCTASGAVNWPKNMADEEFDMLEVGKDRILLELLEECGIRADQIHSLRPTALCREFLRGGKTQMFFDAFTELSYEELTACHLNAKNFVKRTGGIVETQNYLVENKLDLLPVAPAYLGHIQKVGMGSEGASCLYYSAKAQQLVV
jgi:hypothetical protein